MIDNMADYKWVNVPADMLINGEVMPLRQNKGSLRGEDVCFLLESMSEIYWVINHSNVSNTMDKTIQGQRYKRVINQFRYWAQISPTQSGKPMKNGTWSKYYDRSSTNYDSPAQIEPSNALQVNELKADASNFDRGKPLNQQAVMDIFDDQSMMRKFQLYQPQYNLIQNATYSVVKTGTQEVHEDVKPPYTWYYKTLVHWDGNTQMYSSEKTTLNGGRFSYDPYYPQLADTQFVKSAIVFVQFYLSYRKYTNERLTRYVFNRCYPIMATVQDGKFVLDSQQVISAVNEFVNDQNLNLNPLDRNNGVTSGYMDMNANWAVVELGDRMNWKQDGGNQDD